MRRIIFFAMFAIAGLLPLLRYQPGVATAGTSAIAAAPPSAAPPSAAAPSGGAPSAAAGTSQIDGPTVDTEFGPYQVRVTFSGTKITDVQIITEPDDSHSRRLASRAASTLREEALQAQSATIDAVSGATVTSEAYAKSLQAAIDAKGK